MFGDYPTTGKRYWLWLAGIVIIGLVSVLLMVSVKGL
jgi:hypothetical protein